MIRFNPDPAAFHAAIAEWTAADPAPFSLVNFIAGRDRAWRGVLERGGRAVAVLARTTGRPAVIASPCEPDGAAVALAAELVRGFGGINGPVAWAEAIACANGGGAAGRMGLRLHRLVGPPRLPRPTAGHVVTGHRVDLAVIRAWIGAFSQEIEPVLPLTVPTDEELLATREHHVFWIAEDRPVSMATAQRPFHGGWSINRVYTPPEHRRYGYAGAVVHATCQVKLAEGATYMALYTDLANPTSNRLYAEIGFVPVCDQVRILWSLP